MHSYLLWSSIIPYLMIHGILCSIYVPDNLFHNLCPSSLWCTSWPGILLFIPHTFLHPIIVFFSQHMYAFSALTLFVGARKGILPVKSLSGWMLAWLFCLEQGADLHMANLMPLPIAVSCGSKSRLVLPSWFYLYGTSSPRRRPGGCKMTVIVVVVVS